MQTILDDALGQVRQEISAICDSEGDLIQTDEVERAIVHLLKTHLEDCRFQDEIQEWLDNLRLRV
jgi:hypothetical protein